VIASTAAILLLLLAVATSDEEALDDVELAARIKRGDRVAFRAFYERHHGMLFGYLRRRGVAAATCEDLIQQAFVTIWERRTEIDDQKSLRAFLFSIGHNRAINHFRDNARFSDVEISPETPGVSDPEAHAEFSLMLETLQASIQKLPERRRAVFELCFIDQLTYREAAEALGISIKTVEHQMGAALKSLRRAFEHYAKETGKLPFQ
jgi:RNA polymerase sigma-70 factor, ECF subfamily